MDNLFVVLWIVCSQCHRSSGRSYHQLERLCCWAPQTWGSTPWEVHLIHCARPPTRTAASCSCWSWPWCLWDLQNDFKKSNTPSVMKKRMECKEKQTLHGAQNNKYNLKAFPKTIKMSWCLDDSMIAQQEKGSCCWENKEPLFTILASSIKSLYSFLLNSHRHIPNTSFGDLSSVICPSCYFSKSR